VRNRRSDLTVLILNLEYLLEFSQTNITGFKKIVKKFDKHYRGCNPSGRSSSSSSIHASEQQQINGADINGSGQLDNDVLNNNTNPIHRPNSSNGNLPNINKDAIAYLAGTSPENDAAGQLSMFNALGIHGRSTPTIYLPQNFPEPTSSLHPQEPFIRNIHSPGAHYKSIFYHYYGGVSVLSLEFWKMVTERTFAKSEKDERLLAEARTVSPIMSVVVFLYDAVDFPRYVLLSRSDDVLPRDTVLV
jgi:hypothetical protein